MTTDADVKKVHPRGIYYSCGVQVSARSWRCADCKSARTRAYLKEYMPRWNAANQEKRREYARIWGKKVRTGQYRATYRLGKIRGMLRKYGLTPADYERLLAEQGGGCAICMALPEDRARGRLYVDHDHVTGAVRGLLCKKCNAGIGMLADSPVTLNAAIAYLGRIR